MTSNTADYDQADLDQLGITPDAADKALAAMRATGIPNQYLPACVKMLRATAPGPAEKLRNHRPETGDAAETR